MEIESLIDTWMYNILGKVDVFIVTYLCKPVYVDIQKVKISNEHKELGFFAPEEIDTLNMPEGYKISIRKAVRVIQ